MTPSGGAGGAGGISPPSLLDSLRTGAGGEVAGASAGTVDGLPDLAGLSAARADAVRSAWTGARLHAGEDGLLSAGGDADLALLVGDWCFAHALRLLADREDLQAIGLLADAIGASAATLAAETDSAEARAEIWARTCEGLGSTGSTPMPRAMRPARS